MISLGKYELHEQLGRGGFGTVYRASDTTLDREVALKVLHPQLMVDEIFIDRFKKEAKALASLDNHHIVTIYDIEDIDGRIAIAMRYLPGGNLKQLIEKNGPLSFEKASSYLLQVMDGLKDAHDQNYIHRDIKPENILLDAHGEAVITDLGLVKVLSNSSFSTRASSGSISGTPNYIAPEIWEGQPATPASDIYSLGCVLYELLTGEVLFEGDTPAYVMKKHIIEGPILVQSQPEYIRTILEKALAMNPLARYQTVEEFAAALSEIADPSNKSNKEVPQRKFPTENKTIPPETGSKNVETGKPLQLDSVAELIKPAIVTPVQKPVDVSESPPSQFRQWWKKLNFIGLLVGLGAILFIYGFLKGWFGPMKGNVPTATQTSQVVQTNTPIGYTQTSPTHTPISFNRDSSIDAPAVNSEQSGLLTKVSEIDGMTMVYVPADEFLMGAADGIGDADEHPQHTVYLDAYYIDQTEVTNAMYALFVSDTNYQTDAERAGKSFALVGIDWLEVSGADWRHPFGPASDINGLNNHPVIHVSWNDASAYCEWAGRRLPTEAEWEKAARGTDGATYPWGEDAPAGNLVNYADANTSFEWSVRSVNDGYKYTSPVGNYPEGASPYQALDMAGNVWEWVADWYDKDYYSQSPDRNPKGPDKGTIRVMRGGAWDDLISGIRTTYRAAYRQNNTNGDAGFRCAWSENATP